MAGLVGKVTGLGEPRNRLLFEDRVPQLVDARMNHACRSECVQVGGVERCVSAYIEAAARGGYIHPTYCQGCRLP
jgi:hypothetical protein